jgi:RNA polymerase sigma-70 factor (ECF subfamily)
MNFSSDDFLFKLQSRDSEVITQLVNQYQEALIKGAMKQGLAFDQAEVVVQNTWGSFFEQTKRFEGRSHIRTYLFGIMYNKTKETFRENKKYTADYDESALEKVFNQEGSYDLPPMNPENWMKSKDFFSTLEDELNKLPQNQKIAFTLKVIDGESTKDICNILGINATNLGVLIYRAKNNLRLALEKSLNK